MTFYTALIDLFTLDEGIAKLQQLVPMLWGRHSREGGNPAPTVDLCLLGDDKARGHQAVWFWW
ncbi:MULTISPECIES: hypothetical protein [unclassified Endozoicomonas]|uniref:hypothetical protein n=1 Tax=unclassified Endozoicomonas TaxID=2644528 RepID=UPI003BB57F7D